MRTIRCFPAIFSKGDNFSVFLFASLGGVAHPKSGLLLTEGVLLVGERISYLRVEPLETENKNENCRNCTYSQTSSTQISFSVCAM